MFLKALVSKVLRFSKAILFLFLLIMCYNHLKYDMIKVQEVRIYEKIISFG